MIKVLFKYKKERDITEIYVSVNGKIDDVRYSEGRLSEQDEEIILEDLSHNNYSGRIVEITEEL